MADLLRVGPTSRIAPLIIVILIIGGVGTAPAQSLNLEGQAGGLVTPFAYTTPSKPDGISFPSAAFHLLSGGNVVGTHYHMSLTVGFLSRVF